MCLVVQKSCKYITKAQQSAVEDLLLVLHRREGGGAGTMVGHPLLNMGRLYAAPSHWPCRISGRSVIH
jgi:hypothetical protein